MHVQPPDSRSTCSAQRAAETLRSTNIGLDLDCILDLGWALGRAAAPRAPAACMMTGVVASGLGGKPAVILPRSASCTVWDSVFLRLLTVFLWASIAKIRAYTWCLNVAPFWAHTCTWQLS